MMLLNHLEGFKIEKFNLWVIDVFSPSLCDYSHTIFIRSRWDYDKQQEGSS